MSAAILSFTGTAVTSVVSVVTGTPEREQPDVRAWHERVVIFDDRYRRDGKIVGRAKKHGKWLYDVLLDGEHRPRWSIGEERVYDGD